MAVPVPRALSARRPRLDAAWRTSLASWLVARVAVGIGFLVAHGAVDGLSPGEPPLALVQGLVAWDGAFYRDIAEVGYGALPAEALRFFPLFPFLGRLLGFVLPGGATTGLVVVANGAALVVGVLLHRLVVHEGGSDRRAATAVWLLALVPASAVLVLAYSEALFLALTIGAFLALRQRRWSLVAVLALLAGTCRPIGALLVLPVLIEVWPGLRGTPWIERATRAAALVAAPIGTALYLASVRDDVGGFLRPLQLQGSGDLRGGWVNPVTRIWSAIGDAPQEGFLGEALHVPWIALFVVLAVVVGRRLPAAYTAYTIAVLVLALSAESLGSFERYSLAAFPLLVAGASVLTHEMAERLVLVASGAALSAFTTLVLLGVFVP